MCIRDRAGADIRLIANARFAVVGKATEKELAKHHIKADIIPAEQTGKGLAGELSSYMGDNDEIKVCIFSAKEASDVYKRQHLYRRSISEKGRSAGRG